MYTVQRDGIYLLTLNIKNVTPNGRINKNEDKFFANVEVAMKSPYGYLSATNWPLLHVTYFKFLHKNYLL